MEEKKKGRLGRWFGIILSVLLLSALSAGIVSFYPRMVTEAKKEWEQEIRENREESVENGQDAYWYSTYLYSESYGILDKMESDYILVVTGAGLCVLLAGLLLPFIKGLGLHSGLKANLPLALTAVLFGITLPLLAEQMPFLILETEELVRHASVQGNWTGMLKEFMTPEREHLLLYQLNEAAWFGILAAWYVCVLSLRQLAFKGLCRYLKENTVTGLLLCFLIRLGKRFVASLKKIDLQERGQSVIIKAVLANLVVVALLCCAWFLGALGAIFYSIGLLLILLHLWNGYRGQYQQVFEATRAMADGLPAEYPEEAGSFSGLCEELKKVQNGFQKAVQEEIKSERMKTELITNVSHDLKTPLTAIITYVDLLKKDTLTKEERSSYLQVLEQKSTRLKTLIEDLFEVSKASSQTISLHPVRMELGALLQEIQVESEDQRLQAGIEFRLFLPEEKIWLYLDSQKTYRIFFNLIENICKYGLRGSRAYIVVENRAEQAAVTLKNISAEEMQFHSEEITERFVRGDRSRNTEGSGLGLAIAKSFTEAQGGSFRIETDGDLFKAVVCFPKDQQAFSEEEKINRAKNEEFAGKMTPDEVIIEDMTENGEDRERKGTEN